MRLTDRGWAVIIGALLVGAACMGLFFPWEAMPWYGLDLR